MALRRNDGKKKMARTFLRRGEENRDARILLLDQAITIALTHAASVMNVTPRGCGNQQDVSRTRKRAAGWVTL